MKKRVLIWSIIAVFLIFLVYLDYKGYDLVESDLDSIVNDVLSDITHPDAASYDIEDYYEKGRILAYSGQVYNPDCGGPFIVVFRKHWLLPVYEKSTHRLSYTNTYISKRGSSVETFAFKYLVYQLDDDHNIGVERQINYRSFWMLCICLSINLVIRSEQKELQELRKYSQRKTD